MRLAWVALVLVVTTCRKESAPQHVEPKPVAVAGDAGVADASVVLVDLTHAVPLTIRVSSRVKNPKILPEHIADHDLETAWNSATNDLSAWIEIETTTPIDQIRMTAGFTGHGPKQEDYFTMNPRISEVSLTADGKDAGKVALDIDRRDLQTIPVHASQLVRIEIADYQMGSKPNWKEASVSELEVWGAAPPGWTPPKKPLVPQVVVDAPLVSADPCAEVDRQRAEFDKKHRNDHYDGPGGEDHAYPPACADVAVPATPGLDPAWRNAAASCETSDEIYGPSTCSIGFMYAGQTAFIEVESQFAHATIKVLQMYQRDVFPGGAQELVVRLDLPSDAEGIAVCRVQPFGCSAVIEVSSSREGWKMRERFEAGQIVLETIAGSPPAGVAGRHPLVFPRS